MNKRGSAAWMVEMAFEEEDFSPERVAWILASVSVGDVRGMFWNLEEFASAFRIKPRTARRWAKDRDVPSLQFTIGGQWFFSKAGVLRAMHEQIALGDEEFPIVVFGASAVDNVVKGVKRGRKI